MQGKKSSSTSRVPTLQSSRRKKSDGQATWKEDFTYTSTSRKPSSSQRSAVDTQLSSNQSVASSSAHRKRETVADSSKSTFARKLSPSQRSVAAPSSRNNKPNQSVVSSSSQVRRKKKKPKTKPLQVQVSDKNGGIKKEVHVRNNAFIVAKSCVDQHKGDANKQCVSLATTERKRNSCEDNEGLHNSISMMCLAATRNGGDFFSPSSDPNGRLDTIQNVLAEYPDFTTGLATTMSNVVTIVKTPGYNCFASERVRNLSDYGGTDNKGCKMLKSLKENGAIVVTDGTQVTADNAHEKIVLILHSMMKRNNQEELKTLKNRGDGRVVIDTQRFDCLNCNNAIANNGGGGKYCPDCIPEVSHIQLSHFFPQSLHPLILSILPHSDSTALLPTMTGRQKDTTRAENPLKSNIETA